MKILEVFAITEILLALGFMIWMAHEQYKDYKKEINNDRRN
jgi:hypothetical protein